MWANASIFRIGPFWPHAACELSWPTTGAPSASSRIVLRADGLAQPVLDGRADTGVQGVAGEQLAHPQDLEVVQPSPQVRIVGVDSRRLQEPRPGRSEHSRRPETHRPGPPGDIEQRIGETNRLE